MFAKNSHTNLHREIMYAHLSLLKVKKIAIVSEIGQMYTVQRLLPLFHISEKW